MWEFHAPPARGGGGLFGGRFLFLALAAVGEREGRSGRLRRALYVGLVAGAVGRTVAVGLLLGLRVLGRVLRLLGLGRAQDPEVVLGVLEVVLRHDAVALRVGVARQLQVLLVHMGRR